MNHDFKVGLNADGTPDWSAWLDEQWVSSMLRGLIAQTPSLLLSLTCVNAVETMRGGKVVFHWNFNLAQIAKDIFAARPIQTEQVFWLTPLRESPLLTNIDLDGLEGIHPDLATIVATFELDGETSKALRQPEHSLIVVPFEIELAMSKLLNRPLHNAAPPEEVTLPRATIRRTSENRFCFGCKKPSKATGPMLQCPGCNIAKFCSSSCQEMADITAFHGEICPVLPDACGSGVFERCLMPAQ